MDADLSMFIHRVISDVRMAMTNHVACLERTAPRFRERPSKSASATKVGEGFGWSAYLAGIYSVDYDRCSEIAPREILAPVSPGAKTFIGLVFRSLSGEQHDRGIRATYYRNPWVFPMDGISDHGFSHQGSYFHVFLLDGTRRSIQLQLRTGFQGGVLGTVEVLVNPWVSR